MIADLHLIFLVLVTRFLLSSLNSSTNKQTLWYSPCTCTTVKQLSSQKCRKLYALSARLYFSSNVNAFAASNASFGFSGWVYKVSKNNHFSESFLLFKPTSCFESFAIVFIFSLYTTFYVQLSVKMRCFLLAIFGQLGQFTSFWVTCTDCSF